ncbi:MAG: cell shape determination protein CcmA [Acidobacteria bacterium]|nr:MAG: cell shape determination protein CcmA [Acidobacteriota bacterium]
MWRNKDSQSTAPGASNAPRVPVNSGSPTSTTTHASWLSPTMRVKGEISGNEDLLVDGKVEGSISVGEHRLTVGHNGHVTGGLAAREIIVRGKVDGNHNIVSESIEIKKDASMIGDVTTRRIVIEDGAGFKGSIEIGESDKQVDSNLDHPIARTLSTSA